MLLPQEKNSLQVHTLRKKFQVSKALAGGLTSMSSCIFRVDLYKSLLYLLIFIRTSRCDCGMLCGWVGVMVRSWCHQFIHPGYIPLWDVHHVSNTQHKHPTISLTLRYAAQHTQVYPSCLDTGLTDHRMTTVLPGTGITLPLCKCDFEELSIQIQ